MKKKGIVYIVQNPAFPHLFKIGCTEKNTIKDRGLNASNVPEDFEILFGYECDNPQEIEKYLHDTFKDYRHYTKTGRKTEFFYIGCLSSAKRPLELLLKQKGATDISGDIALEKDNTLYDETKNIENMTRKAKMLTFSMVDIKPGDILVFTKNEKQECKVVNDRMVSYKGEEYYLSPLARKLIKEGNYAPNNKAGAFRGPDFFKLKGTKETLTERRERMENS